MKRLTIISTLLLVLAACTTYTETTRFDGEDEKPAHIRGIVTSMNGTTITVEGNPEDPTDAVKGTITLVSETEYQRLDGSAASVADLLTGQLVSVWLEGEMPERFPVQGNAARVLIGR